MQAESITVVVPVWNRRGLLEALLRNLGAQTIAIAEIIVVDNGSTDGAAEAAEAAGARVLRMGSNRGFAPAVNRGIRESRTPWVAVVNNDVELASDYFELLLRGAMAGSAWFATGKIFAVGQRQLLDGAFDLLCRGGTAWRAGHAQSDSAEFASRRTIYSAPWTAALFRSDLFDRTGLLEESFGSYLEDVEFGVRCACHCCPGIFVPEAEAWHFGSATLGVWHPETVRLISRNQLLLAARHFPYFFAWPVLVAQLLWGVVAWRHGAARAWLRGKREAVSMWRAARRTYRTENDSTLADWLRSNERLLAAAPSRYWRVYCLLTHSGAK